MHEITDMDTYYELLADRRAARIYEKTRARHPTREIRIIQGHGSRRRTARSGAELGPGDSGVSRCLITSTGSHSCAINAQKKRPLDWLAGRGRAKRMRKV